VKCTVYASFRPSTATSRRLPVKWRLFRVTSGPLRSRDVISCHVIAYSCELHACRKWNVQYTPVFGLLQPLPGDFRSNHVTSGSLSVTWRHFLSRDCLLLRVTALYEVKCTVYTSFRPFTATSRWRPVKLRHFLVTSGHLRWRDVISCHVTASSCELHPCRKWNAQYTPVFGLLQPLPCDFRSNDVTSGHLRSHYVISCYVTASSGELQPCRKWNVQYTPVFGLLQPLPGDLRSNYVTSGSFPVIWGHVTSLPVTWLPPPASCSLVGSEMYTICQFSVFYSFFQVTSGQMTSLPGHFRSPEITWRHFPSCDCLLRATGL